MGEIDKMKRLAKRLLIKANVLMLGIVAYFQVATVYADNQNLGGVATTVIANFGEIAKLITAGSYIAGMGFFIGAILKFKAHKDNPTQIPVGTPIALIFIAAALLFLPSIFGTVGGTLFSGGGTTAGVSGITNFKQSS